MTIQGFLDLTDTLPATGAPLPLRLRWLSEIEGRVRVELLGEAPEDVPSIGEDTARETALATPAPYDRLYWMYYLAMADSVAGDTARYENAAALFNEAYASYGRYLKRRGA